MTETIPPTPAARTMQEVLELEQLDVNLFRSRANQINRNRSLFGGQILGQGLKAAALTVEPGRLAHSLHGYFLLAGVSDIPVIYDVELTRDGGSFSTRRVVAKQRGKTIFHMELSFHREERGLEHEITLDADVPDPEQLLTTRELVLKYADKLPEHTLAMAEGQSIVELKPVNPEDFFTRHAASARSSYWIKSTTPLSDDPLTQRAAVAYLSDYFLTSTVLMSHMPAMIVENVMMASLDHAMWFHRPCRADDWMLVNAISPFAGGARGFTRGEIFGRDRRLVASVAQEGLVRVLEAKK
jgi:acyl-CoA thioesterase II